MDPIWWDFYLMNQLGMKKWAWKKSLEDIGQMCMALFEHFYGQLKSFVPLALTLKPLQNGLKCGAAQQVHLTGTLLMVVPAKLEIYESNSLSQKKKSAYE